MLRWLGPRRAPQPPAGPADRPRTPELIPSVLQDDDITDDPLAAFDGKAGLHLPGQKQIYSVSRSVLLPRVTLKNSVANCGTGGRVNPLFRNSTCPNLALKTLPQPTIPTPIVEKSSSSGYGGSNTEDSTLYIENTNPLFLKQHAEAVSCILEQNPVYVKSIKVPSCSKLSTASVKNGRSGSSSSGGGTLTTIPEGRVESIPKPIWPMDGLNYDSIVDDALLLYTSLNNHDDGGLLVNSAEDNRLGLSVRDVLIDLLHSINATMEGTTGVTPEEMLKAVNEKIALSIETLKNSTEEEMRRLCINLSNCKKINSVLRAFGTNNSSTASSSRQSSPEWNASRVRTISSDTDEFYHTPTGSSSSGFSDSHNNNTRPVFVHEDLTSFPDGVRNAMIYGTLCRPKSGSYVNGILCGKKNSLIATGDNKPSVWEQYYGVRASRDEADKVKTEGDPTDVPLFPGGRPEADFTLDVPRSEMLSKKMEEDKKWRCRCRWLTSFLGLIFFLLSLMAVSLILTRGKRMFGSMM